MTDYFLYLACLILGGAGAWLVFRWGNVFGLLDKANKRSSHEGVIPKGGGIGILAAFVFASLFLDMPLAFWLSATILALLSLSGDRIDISPKIRLPAQFVAALLFLLLTPPPYLSPLTFYPSPITFFSP